MLCRPASPHRYLGQLRIHNLVRIYGNYLVRVAVPNSSAHPSRRTLDGQGPMERLCYWDRCTGRKLEAVHNCQVLVATVAAAVVHSWNIGSSRSQW